MKSIIILLILFFSVSVYSCEDCSECSECSECNGCPNTQDFIDAGWVIHSEKDFGQILQQKLNEFIPEFGVDLVLDFTEFYKSDFTHDYYLIMSIIILDRVSTPHDEMWGDVAFTKTDCKEPEYIELRWYDPVTKKKHIVRNAKYVCCLSTKIPLAYNTIF